MLSCAYLGSLIAGMTIPDFRKLFNLVNDFTPEEEAEQFDEKKLFQQIMQMEEKAAIENNGGEGD